MAARHPAVEIGSRYGRGVVVGLTRKPLTDALARQGCKQGRAAARMLCDCGTAYIADLRLLRSGDSQSCGCLHSDRASQNVKALAAQGRWSRTHGLSQHPLFGGWYRMIQRCENPENPRYADWGGRGIKVCKQWHDPARYISDIESLLGPKPSGHTLDRVDNHGHYEPGNVRWATAKEQRANQRPYPKRRRIPVP